MTPLESRMLQAIQRFGGSVTWNWLRVQFCLTSGALQVVLNSLKRHVLIEQDGLYYRLTSFGKEALGPRETTRQAFGGREAW